MLVIALMTMFATIILFMVMATDSSMKKHNYGKSMYAAMHPEEHGLDSDLSRYRFDSRGRIVDEDGKVVRL